MKNYGNSFEDTFKDAFQNAELEPPSGQLWDNIDKELHRAPRTRALWWVGGIAASAVVTLLFFIEFKDNTALLTAQHQQTVTTQPSVNPSNQTDRNTIAAQTQTVDPQNQSNTQGSRHTLNDKTSAVKDQLSKDDLSLAQAGSKNAKGSKKTTDQHTVAATKEVALLTAAKDQPTKNTSEMAGQGSTNVQLPADAASAKEPMLLLDALAPGLLLAEMEKPALVMNTLPLSGASAVNDKAEKGGYWWAGVGGFYNVYNPNIVTSVQPASGISRFVKGTVGIYVATDTDFHQDMTDSVSYAPSFSTGAEFGRTLCGKGFGISSGLYYTQSAFAVNSSVVSVRGSDIFASDSVEMKNTVQGRVTMLSVPLKLHYQSDRSTWNYGVAGGVMADFVQSSELRSELSSVSYQFAPYRRMNLSGMAAASLSYRMGTHWSIGVEANYRRALGNAYQSKEFKSTPQWIGFGATLKYKF